ncbi:hypothetical protein ISI01_05925 [Burkholderia pseudomallei]|nr:hypothetical protein [Burkholderia pseudomallei]MBF3540825.1 hypothetical protein [Burkholderia pseudomallei]MBF4017300.1 hypothetical protein [Burkholderia pseudomallei]
MAFSSIGNRAGRATAAAMRAHVHVHVRRRLRLRLRLRLRRDHAIEPRFRVGWRTSRIALRPPPRTRRRDAVRAPERNHPRAANADAPTVGIASAQTTAA